MGTLVSRSSRRTLDTAHDTGDSGGAGEKDSTSHGNSVAAYEWDRWDDPALRWVRYSGQRSEGFSIDNVPVQLGHSKPMREEAEKEHGDTFNYVFDASLAMSKVLENNRQLINGRRVLELGAGRGVAGFAAALLGAEFVTVTDLPAALDVLKQGVVLNSFSPSRVEVADLNWFSPDVFFTARPDQCFDVVLASDCVWLEDLLKPFMETLHFFCKINPSVDILVMNLDRLGTVGDSFMEMMANESFEVVWCLPGGDPAIWAIGHPGVCSGGIEWDPGFIPNARMNLRCFRLMQPRDVLDAIHDI